MSLHTGKPPKSTRKDPRGREEARRENRDHDLWQPPSDAPRSWVVGGCDPGLRLSHCRSSTCGGAGADNTPRCRSSMCGGVGGDDAVEGGGEEVAPRPTP